MAETNERAVRQEARLELILERVRQNGATAVEALAADLDVSLHTIRRDLQDLHERGLLRRTHGGAAPIEPLFYEPFRQDRSFQEQVTSFADEKRRIGRAAAALVQEGEVIALTAGTTATECVRFLPPSRRLTVITNTVNVAMELSKRKDIDVHVTGGHLRGDWFSLVGPAAREALNRVVIDTLFIGANGIDFERGLTCFNPEEADVNRTMIERARRKIVVTDHSKFETAAPWVMCGLLEVDLVITDSGVSAHHLERLRQIEVDVLIV